MSLTERPGWGVPADRDPADGEDWLVRSELAPHPEGVLAPLYQAAAAGLLCLPFCASCGQVLELDQTVCDGCGGGALSWRSVAQRGVVHSATMVHRIEGGLLRATDPYPVVDVEVASGHRLVMTTTGPQASAPRIGEPVTIGFRQVGEVHLPAVMIATPEVTP
jgi:uncharacterized protein